MKRGARGFSILLGPTKASRRHFLLQPICVGRKEVLTIVGHFTFLEPTTVEDHQRAVTKRIIKINPPDETTCIALRLRDNKKRIVLSCSGWKSHLSTDTAGHGSPGYNEWLLLVCSYILHALPSLIHSV